MSINITINGKSYKTSSGITIFDVCNKNGVEIPTLCHIKGRNDSSCSICLVKDVNSGALLTSCSTLVEDDMEILTNGEEVVEARKESLEILLSEHVGDCEAPCHTACPLGFDIPSIMDNNKQEEELFLTIIQHIPFPSITSRLCKAPCQRACRRDLVDKPIEIKQTIQEISDNFLHSDLMPTIERSIEETVAINVTSYSLLAAAFKFRLYGYRVYITNNLESEEFLNGVDKSIVKAEIERLKLMGILLSKVDDYDYLIDNNDISDGSHIAISIKHGFNFSNKVLKRNSNNRVISSMGRIYEEEMGEYLNDHKTEDRDEKSKCLHCDCIGKDHCSLRDYSKELSAHQHSFRVNTRDSYRPVRDFGLLLYDANRCILCSKCIQVATQHNRDITYINRGYRSEIFIPQKTNRTPIDKETAIMCEDVCPTTALYYRGDKR